MVSVKIYSAKRVAGVLRVPGDKSIAHRALMLGAFANAPHSVEGLPRAADVRSTIACLRTLGVSVDEAPDGRVTIEASALESNRVLDAGNSGTTARLMCGLLAGRRVRATIDGDESLRARPMARVVDPLNDMGARVLSAGGRLPITLAGGQLRGITYTLPIASAQVKSAILLAGLCATGTTSVIETQPTRDHTERMLEAMGAAIRREPGRTIVKGGAQLQGAEIEVPGDISSAAFFIVAAACVPSSELRIQGVGVNPTRIGVLEVLDEMGADIEIIPAESLLLEPVADVIVRPRALNGIALNPAIVPTLIDELPLLAVAATQAEGETTVSGADELRYKESNRIVATVDNLTRMGASIEERPDGFVVRGPTPLRGARVSAFGDHRMAMAMAIAGLLAEGGTTIDGGDTVDISYPDFFNDLHTIAS